MTALDQFQRLEAPGIWRETADAQRHDVIVAFGDATLTIATSSGAAVSHWSLAAINRVNPGLTPALFSPGHDSAETLEIDDDDMIAAIEKVRAAVISGAAQPRRLRRWLGLVAFVAVLALTVLWGPRALVSYATSIVPPETRAKIGNGVLEEIRARTQTRCAPASATVPLKSLVTRLGPGFLGRIAVAQEVWPSRSLPGGIVVLDARLFEAFNTPDVAAGFALAEFHRLSDQDPLADMMTTIGTMGTIQLLTTGTIDDAKIKAYAQVLSEQSPVAVSGADLIEAFRLTRVNPSPFVAAVNESETSAVSLGPLANAEVAVTEPVLADNQWVQLQAICE